MRISTDEVSKDGCEGAADKGKANQSFRESANYICMKMFRHKCSNCEWTCSKSRSLGWEGRFLCRESATIRKRESLGRPYLRRTQVDAAVTGTYFSETFAFFSVVVYLFVLRLAFATRGWYTLLVVIIVLVEINK